MKTTALRFLSALILVSLLLAGQGVRPVYAAGYTVNSLADTIANDGSCTLREAIQEANNGADTDCPGSPSAADDTITFSVSGIITLGSTLPNIVSGQGALTIDGGNSIIISGNNSVRVMSVNNGATLTLQNLTIANGRISDVGGGILSSGTLTVINSTFAGNSAFNGAGGAILNSGTLTVINSAFSGNSAGAQGGGVLNTGTMTVTNSTFSGNATFGADGGGITNAGRLTVINSTFSGNRGGFDGGGIANLDTLTVINSTFSGNSAGGFFGGGGIYNEWIATLQNTIIANSTAGGDCYGTLTGASINNLIEDSASACGLVNGVNGNIIGVDPNLGAPTGFPAYFPLNSGSPAIDAGDNAACAAAPVNNQSQNGVTRPQDGNGDSLAVCDIGSYEAPNTIVPPTVNFILRADPNPTSAASVDFFVIFSEDVTGVDASDFTPTVTSGSISGASVTGVTAINASIYTVAVNTGAGSGTLRLDLNASGTGIQDLDGNPIVGGFTSGAEYTVQKLQTATFRSMAAYDGFALESGENTSAGGLANATGYFLYAGDNALRRQYVSFLHFDTSSLPDTAVVTGLALQVKQYRIVGVNPFTVLGNLQVDIANPFFGTAITLIPADFQAPAGAANVGAFNPTPLSGGWYQAALNPSAFPLINLTGATQFRLAFSLDDNNDSQTNAALFYSGNHPTTSYRPVLIVEYYVP